MPGRNANGLLGYPDDARLMSPQARQAIEDEGIIVLDHEPLRPER